MSFRDVARKLGLGPVARHVWHTPKNAIERVAKEGAGAIAGARIGRDEMELAAYDLRPAEKDFEGAKMPVEVTFLTGGKFWYQTVFCGVSLLHAAQRSIGIAIVDDGTLEDAHVHQFKRVFPKVRLHPAASVEERVREALPPERFPVLHERRINYPHIRKLTDVHAGSTGWKVVLDSDMLFFRRPGVLLEWLYGPERLLHMVDTADSYGYSAKLMAELAGEGVPQRLNVGMIGLKSESIDWEKVESWAATMIEREGTHYFLEQALTAMLVAGEPRVIAPPDEYVVLPEEDEVKRPAAVLHHYVAESKNHYFRYGWRKFLEEYGPEDA